MRNFVWCIGVLAASCGPAEGELADVAPSVCASGKQWTGGREGSSLMDPGQDCIACHASEGDAPKFVVAGTVFPGSADADNCGGSSGVTVEITDANGKVTTMTTDAAGNFSSRTAGPPPYMVLLKSGTLTRAMGSAASSGSCNSCHTAAGASGATGRVMAPK